MKTIKKLKEQAEQAEADLNQYVFFGGGLYNKKVARDLRAKSDKMNNLITDLEECQPWQRPIVAFTAQLSNLWGWAIGWAFLCNMIYDLSSGGPREPDGRGGVESEMIPLDHPAFWLAIAPFAITILARWIKNAACSL